MISCCVFSSLLHCRSQSELEEFADSSKKEFGVRGQIEIQLAKQVYAYNNSIVCLLIRIDSITENITSLP